MKPNFALDLSHDGISLLFRDKGGWALVGEVALDDPDLGARLAALRSRAEGLAPEGLTAKLIIPNSQILYTTLEAPGPDDIAREVQIRAALDGLTPYAVGDLVFDWRAEGTQARVAVLARETMDEAEAFAVDHGFNPVSFVARPESGDFSGEPFFGKSRAAAGLLGATARVTPDASPVPRKPRALPAVAEAVTEPVTAPDTETETPAATRAPERAEPPVAAPPLERPDHPTPEVATAPAGEAEPRQAESPETQTPETQTQAADPIGAAITTNAVAPEADAPKPPAAPPQPRKPRAPRPDPLAAPVVLAPFPPAPDDEPLAPAPRPRAPSAKRGAGTAERTPAAPAPRAPETQRAEILPSPAEAPARPADAEAFAPETKSVAPAPSAPIQVGVPPEPAEVPPEAPASRLMLEAADRTEPPEAPPAFTTRRSPEAGETAPAERLASVAPRLALPTGDAAPQGPIPPLPSGTTAKQTAGTAPGPRVDLPPAAAPKLDPIRAAMAEALAKPLPRPGTPAEPAKPAAAAAALAGLGMRLAAAATRAKTGTRRGLVALSELSGQTTTRLVEARAKRQAEAAAAKAANPAKATAPQIPPATEPAAENPAENSTVSAALAPVRPEPAASARPAARPAKPAPEKPALLKSAKLAKPLFGRKSAPARSAEDVRRAKEAEAMTVFGARNAQEIGGKPKHLGLVLTLVLVLLMTVVAVWTSQLSDDGEAELFNPAPDVAANAPETAPEPPAADLNEPDVTVPNTAEVLSPEAAEARYAATGIWERAPEPLPAPPTAALAQTGAAATPPVAAAGPRPDRPSPPGLDAEALPPAPLGPPPAGTRFDLDASGLVRATPEGAISPAGILVTAGRPPVVPPRRLEALAPAQTAAPDATPDAAPPPEAAAPFQAPDIPRLRPPARPADLVPPEPAAPEPAAPQPDQPLDDASLSAPASPTALAAVPVPPARPANLAAEADLAAAQSAAAIDAAVEGIVETAFANASDLAVATSRRPGQRPSDFDAIVERARASASDGSTVAALTEDDAEPEPEPVSRAAPAIPTSASVATQATVKNAINLRDMNLIGIYGTANARRALVRMSNGRYVKVKVGDRLDGGTVTAISNSRLTYQKGSRSYALDVLPLG